MSRRAALVDLVVIVAVVTGAWSLRFAEIPYAGPLAMFAGIGAALALLKLRGQAPADIGLGPVPPVGELLREAARLLPWFGLAWLAGGFVGVALFGQPQASSAIIEQPEALLWFLFDITVITWILIAFGEEFVFRGFVLQRLLAVFGGSGAGRWLACLLQAIWFGSLHASQGAAGMLMTGCVGFAFAAFIVIRPGRSLWPLILVHGVADTLVLLGVRLLA